MHKETTQYQKMVYEINKVWSNKEVIFCGGLKKARDLEFFFKIEYSKISDFQSADIIGDNTFVIFESAKMQEAQSLVVKCDLKSGHDYCYDEDLFCFVEQYIMKECFEGNVAIWGTGKVADYFWTNCKNDNLKRNVQYYIDSNIEMKGRTKNGIPIITPQDTAEIGCKIIVAVNYNNFYDIKEQCREIGIAEENYQYYTSFMNDAVEMLRKTYYDKSYYNAECLHRDQNIRIKGQGDVTVCCLSSDKNVMGNIHDDSFESIWSSIQAQVCRLALVNHTFTFCNHFRCPYLAGIPNLEIPEVYLTKYNFYETAYPECIAPEIDISCNLHCTSCRKEIYVEENRSREIFLQEIKDKIVHLPTRLLINTVGEPFASKYCMDLISDIHTMKRKSLSIYSNGTLLTPQKLDWLLSHYEMLELSISVDAATEETYAGIRRGGNFKKLLQNIEYISMKKRQGKISYWQVNFVVQRDNVREMDQFVKMADEWGVDRIAMNAIENWGVYTDSEYENVSIIEAGEIKEEYRKCFTNNVIENTKVDLFNLAYFVGTKPKYNRMM